MPNWVTNIITIKCPNENAEQVKRFLEGEGGCFDFEKIVPPPPTMNMVSGSLTDQAIVAYISDNCTLPLDNELMESAKDIGSSVGSRLQNHYERTKKIIEKDGVDALYDFGASSELKLTLYDAGKIYCENLMAYGALDWYDFNCNNWGTKWNACEACLIDESPTELSYQFETAWSMPFPIFCKLTEVFKDIEIKVEYADEDFGSNCGRITFSNGVDVDSYIPENYKEGQELAAEVLGYDLTSDLLYSEKLGYYVWADYFEEAEAEYDEEMAKKAAEKDSEKSAEENLNESEEATSLKLETESGVELTF